MSFRPFTYAALVVASTFVFGGAACPVAPPDAGTEPESEPDGGTEPETETTDVVLLPAGVVDGRTLQALTEIEVEPGSSVLFTASTELGILPAFDGEIVRSPFGFSSVAFTSSTCGGLTTAPPSRLVLEETDPGLDVVITDESLTITPLDVGVHTFRVSGRVPDGWGPIPCLPIAGADGSFEITMTVTVFGVDRVVATFPERCQGQDRSLFFPGDRLSAISIELQNELGERIFPGNFDALAPVPLEVSADAPLFAIDSESWLDDVIIPENVSLIAINAPGLRQTAVDVASVDDIIGTEATFFLTGMASFNIELTDPQHGDDGWGRTRNVIAPVVNSVTVSGGIKACTIQTPPMVLTSSTEDVCDVHDAGDLDIIDSGTFNTEELFWFLDFGRFATMKTDGLCELELSSVDGNAAFTSQLSVTIVNVDQLIPIEGF